MANVAPIQIDRRKNLSPEAFRAEYYEPHRPVVMSGPSKTWRALEVLTPAYLKERIGHVRISFDSGTYSVREILERLEASDPANPAPYPCKLNLDTQVPELKQLFDPLPLVHSEPNRVKSPLVMAHRFGSKNELFLGGPGGEFPYIHYDYYHLNAWVTQVYGEKEFSVYSAPSEDCFYPVKGDEWRSGVENPFNPDLTKYPLFRDVVVSKIVVGPGETLFIPNGTWHSAKSLTLTMSVAFDQLGAQNMPAFIDDVYSRRVHSSPLKAALLRTYLKGVGAALTAEEKLRG